MTDRIDDLATRAAAIRAFTGRTARSGQRNLLADLIAALETEVSP